MAKKLTKKDLLLKAEWEKGISTLSARFRGEVLERCVEVEMAINAHIMYFFHKDDIDMGVKLVNYLLDRMSFDAKISVFQHMLQTKFEKDYKKSCDKMMGKIRALKDHRNVFAHYMTYIGVDAPSTGVNYYKMRNELDFTHYDVNAIGVIFEQTKECVNWIETLTKEI
jgi:hypothetical protein